MFSDPGFEGMLAVLEAGVYPFPEAWGFPSPFVGSLRPLKIVCISAQHPMIPVPLKSTFSILYQQLALSPMQKNYCNTISFGEHMLFEITFEFSEKYNTIS